MGGRFLRIMANITFLQFKVIYTLLFLKSITARKNGRNDSKFYKHIDQFTAYNRLRFQSDGVRIGPTTSKVNVM